jgi:hypothetical protein
VEKHGKGSQAAGENKMLRRRDAIYLPDNYGKNTETHSKNLILVSS